MLLVSFQPRIERKKNMLLNIKCCVQLIFSITPPHEHGSWGENNIIYAMYSVNAPIIIVLARKPYSLENRKNRRILIRSSAIGTDQDKRFAFAWRMGDWESTSLNLSISKSLLAAVYTNKKIKTAAMKSSNHPYLINENRIVSGNSKNLIQNWRIASCCSNKIASRSV